LFTSLPSHLIVAAAVAAALCVASATKGQDEPEFKFGAIEIAASGDGDGAAALASGMSSIAIGGPGGFISSNLLGGVDPNNRSQLFQLLSNDSIRRELKLTEEQQQGVAQIIQENGKRMQERVRQAIAQGGGGIGSLRLDFSELMRVQREQSEAAIEEILLPEQLKRVRQLAYQIEIAQEGLGESLVNGRLGKDIGVYDQQKQQLTDRARDIEQELRAVIAKAHSAARMKLFAELTPDQRKAAEELVGDYFQYEESNLRGLMKGQLKKVEERRDRDRSPRKDR
jgi:hypothetical protein